jgi:hypothetical protein
MGSDPLFSTRGRLRRCDRIFDVNIGFAIDA